MSLLGKLIQLLRNSMAKVGAGFVRETTSSTGIPLERGQAEISMYFLEDGNLRVYLADHKNRVVATMPRERAIKLRDYMLERLGNPLLERRKPVYTRRLPELEKIIKPKLSIVTPEVKE